MIAAGKRQAIEGLASTLSGKAEAVQATKEAELTRLHAKISQLVVERGAIDPDWWTPRTLSRKVLSCRKPEFHIRLSSAARWSTWSVLGAIPTT